MYLLTDSTHFGYTVSCLLSSLVDIIMSNIKKKKSEFKTIRKLASDIVEIMTYFDMAQLLLFCLSLP